MTYPFGKTGELSYQQVRLTPWDWTFVTSSKLSKNFQSLIAMILYAHLTPNPSFVSICSSTFLFDPPLRNSTSFFIRSFHHVVGLLKGLPCTDSVPTLVNFRFFWQVPLTIILFFLLPLLYFGIQLLVF